MKEDDNSRRSGPLSPPSAINSQEKRGRGERGGYHHSKKGDVNKTEMASEQVMADQKSGKNTTWGSLRSEQERRKIVPKVRGKNEQKEK